MTPRKTQPRTIAMPSSSGLLVAVFLLGIYAATLLWATGGFLARVESVSRWSFVLAVGTSICLLPIAARWFDVSLRKVVRALFFALVVYAACCFLAAFFWDISFDGQTYHAQAILAMANGWNPAHDTLPADLPNRLWVQHYGKGYEYAAYGIYSVTRNLESCKGLNSMLLVASALVMCSAATPHLHPSRGWMRQLLLLLAVLNPIAVFTLFTFYVDGQIASCLLMLLAAVAIFNRAPRAGGVLLFTVLLILAQLKFTALVYGVLAVCGGAVFLFAYNRRRVGTYMVVCGLAGIIAVGWVGYNPYVRNVSEHGHPFHPLMGAHSISIMGGTNSPPSFEHKSSVRKLAEASFARSRNVHGAAIAPEPVPKIPFTFELKEWTVFKSHDVRIGGFGPLWGGALVLTILAALLAIYALRGKRSTLAVLAGGCALLLGLTLVNPESWCARYVPQLWWLPLWITAFALRFGGRAARIFSIATLLVMGVNLGGTAAVSIASDAVLTSEIRSQLSFLRQRPAPVKVSPHAFAANDARLNAAGIVIQPLANADTLQLLTDHRSLTLQNSGTKIYYKGPPYQPGPLFARLARYINPGKNEH